MHGCHPLREDQARPIAMAVLDAMDLIASGASSARLRALLLGLRVPAAGGVLALSADHAALLAGELPGWAGEPGGAALAGQAITLFLERRAAG